MATKKKTGKKTKAGRDTEGAPAKKHANGKSEAVVLREPIERKRFKEKLPVPISRNHLETKSQELAKVINDREAILVEKRAVNAEYREKLSFYDERLLQLAVDCTTHSEAREVECVEELVIETQTVRTVRLDTGAVIKERAATSDDLQVGIDMAAAPPATTNGLSPDLFPPAPQDDDAPERGLEDDVSEDERP